MIVKGILFDVNGTLVDIRTDESYDEIYRVLSNLLSYHGVTIDAPTLRDLYFHTMKAQRDASTERHPEFDAVGIFRDILSQYATDFTRALPSGTLEHLPRYLAATYRAVSRFRLQLYPGVKDTLMQLQGAYRLAIVSDAQTSYALPELHAVGLSGYFDPIIVSGDFGYRKPHERLFTSALAAMGMQPSEVLYVGNDMYRDIYGARRAGIKAVFIRSNQGLQEKEGVAPDYIIYQFPELLQAVRFFESQ